MLYFKCIACRCSTCSVLLKSQILFIYVSASFVSITIIHYYYITITKHYYFITIIIHYCYITIFIHYYYRLPCLFASKTHLSSPEKFVENLLNRQEFNSQSGINNLPLGITKACENPTFRTANL